MATSWLARRWDYLLVRGLIALVFGILAMIWPMPTVLALAIAWGIWALSDGVFVLAQGLGQATPVTRWTLVVTGVVSLVVALVDATGSARGVMLGSALVDVLLGTLIINPGRGAVAIALVLGLTAFAWGVAMVVLAWLVRRSAAGSPAEDVRIGQTQE